MRRAARAIIIEGDKMLVMHRNKYGTEYFTLVGGLQKDNETTEQALAREVKEETGLDIIKSQLVYIEEHPAPYNEQYIFLCQVAPHESIAIQDTSEEGFMNKLDMNIHKPVWIHTGAFARLQFRTPQLHIAITEALKKGFPSKPIKL